MDSAKRTPIDRDELVDALHRVCADPVFARSPQLRRLLEYLVQCALAGNCHPKEYTIAIDALGRSADFDPDHDSIVRVQAGRLRRALDKYYAGPGRHDRVRIDLPTGSYVVARHDQDVAPAIPAPPRPRSTRAIVFAGTLVLIMVAFLMPPFGGGIVFAPSSAPTTDGPPVLSTSNGLPLIVIEPYDGSGASIDAVPALNGLRRKIASAFARFETVNAVYRPRVQVGTTQVGTTQAGTTQAGITQVGTTRADRRRPIADERIYSLSTILGADKSRATVLFQLTDHSDGTVAWARTFDLPGADDIGSGQDRIASMLATTLVQSFGVIPSRERAYHLRTGRGDLRYRCILQAMDALHTANGDDYAAAVACLENVTTSDPGHVLANAYLALILNRNAESGRPDHADVLGKALAAANRAVHGNPSSARAHYALFVTRHNMGEYDAAEVAMAKARALNDNDVLMRYGHGGRLVIRGQIDAGTAILDEVESVFPPRTCIQGFHTFLGHYLRGNQRVAHRYAHELTCSHYAFAFLAKALVTHDAGKPEIARTAINSLAALLPAWRTDPRAALGRTIPDAAIVERILRDLASAGLIASAQN